MSFKYSREFTVVTSGSHTSARSRRKQRSQEPPKHRNASPCTHAAKLRGAHGSCDASGIFGVVSRRSEEARRCRLLRGVVQLGLDAKTSFPRSRRANLTPPRVHSTVRGAMVGVMLAGASLRHQLHAGAPSAPQPPPALVEGIAGGVRHGIGGNSHDVDDGGWSSALAAENESGALPRDTSTCVLWCATALGALVRGVPLDHVGVSWRAVESQQL